MTTEFAGRDVAPGTIVVYSDIGCPWSHAAVWRLWDARSRLGLDDAVRFDHRAFPLELVNSRATPKLTLDAEIPGAGALAPRAGWQVWQAPDWQYPSTTLPALEAVQAAKEQGLGASEELDLALRRAFFGESRCVALRHVVLEAAATCDTVDVDRLRDALDGGRARNAVIDQWMAASRFGARGSPHVFLADGSDHFNPGVEIHWQGEEGEGFPIVDRDDPSAYEELLRRAGR